MTTQTLEDVIRDLAKRGELTHLSLTPSQDGKKWRASFAMSSKFGISFGEDVDPVKALILACTTAKMKPRPAERKAATTIDLSPEEVTMRENAEALAASVGQGIDDNADDLM